MKPAWTRRAFLGWSAVTAAAPWAHARDTTPAGFGQPQNALRPGLVYLGACDASASVEVDGQRFLMCDDESNIMRLYHVNHAEPLAAFDLNNYLAPETTWPEADIEGACRIGTRSYWITSHGRNRSAEVRKSRYRFFACDLDITPSSVQMRSVGRAYSNLLLDLIDAPHLATYRFREFQFRAPKERDAINIEGLAPMRDAHALWIGFRNPIPRGNALLVPLLNPDEVLCDQRRAEFGPAAEIYLEGLGIREIDFVPAIDAYLIVAGGIDTGGRFGLFRWSGDPGDSPLKYGDVHFGSLNPEAMVVFPESNQVLILSDDGTRRVGELPCKEVPNCRHRGFRTAWFRAY